MQAASTPALETFKLAVGTRFQLYNSLFTALPFHRIEKTGVLLSLFLHHCEESFAKGMNPTEIVEQFFAGYTSFTTTNEQTDLLFRFIQYAERQVVLFDAVEDAAFEQVNDLFGTGTLKQLKSRTDSEDKEAALLEKLNSFRVMLVLTAHPTQFYPGSVLGIINDLAKALKENDTLLINTYLQQLGKTPLFKQQKPTPYDEAVSLIWYLENTFYHAIGHTLSALKAAFPVMDLAQNPVIQMGFWPGGDRDGNPSVTADTTLKVAGALHAAIIRCYYAEVRQLRRRLTFKGVEALVTDLESRLYRHGILHEDGAWLSPDDVLQPLLQIRNLLIEKHNSLFLPPLDELIHKVHAFGVHFASLDIRQESTAHAEVWEAISEQHNALNGYTTWPDEQKLRALSTIDFIANPNDFDDLVKDTLLSIDSIAQIQERVGEKGCHRYIISQCGTVLNVLEVYALFLVRGWKPEAINVDIVPLFETIEDLANAPVVMRDLYGNETYKAHLQRRGNKQVVMVGFSDGTKDGGYLMANWSIYKAKEKLTAISVEQGVQILFFDGRGGPPARGGGKTHKFYASMGRNISTEEIQLTVQGQTVSSNFGIVPAAQYNIEQLLNAGIANTVFGENERTLSATQAAAVQQLADSSYKAYKALKDHPDFLDYLSDVSPLKYYSETNISSRPAKRGGANKLLLKDLRAIPFVGAWSQIKQNVPGYYGLGTALAELESEGKLEEIKHLYERSGYFKTLIDNCEMAMKKSYFPLTAHLASDRQYAGIWKMIADEYNLTWTYLQKLSGHKELMEPYPVEALSIQMRERVVLPLTTIQQYALARLRHKIFESDAEEDALQKLIIRSSFGIINAGRNSV